MSEILAKFQNILNQFSDDTVHELELLAQSGSSRRYFRIHTAKRTYIGTEGKDLNENRTFIGLARHFSSQQVSVPKLYAHSADYRYYIQEDLGNTSLYNFLPAPGEAHTQDLFKLYQQSVDLLLSVHMKGSESIDFNHCYPTADFDALSIQWDLEYFKYYFLKLNDLSYDEYALQEELNQLRDMVAAIPRNCFMVRDFQSRNIMIHDAAPVLIDFQGGRRGPYQYDLVSLLWQARANLPHQWKDELKDRYLKGISESVSMDEVSFNKDYWLIVLIRTMQVLGAYGLRGVVQRKQHFLSSIPFAVENLKYLLVEKSWYLPALPQIKQAFIEYINRPSN